MMRRGHWRGKGRRRLTILRGWPRHGGWNPLKVVAVFAAIVAGGVVAAMLGALLMVIFAILGVVTTGAGFLLTYGWIVAAFLIYHAIRKGQSRRQETPQFAEEEWRQAEVEREREYQRRLAQMQQCAGAPPTRPRKQSNVGAGALAVLSGFALALGANVALGGLNLPPVAGTVLPPLTGAVAGLGVFAALKRWVINPPDEEKPPAREVKAQISRIRRKARDLQHEANEAGGVFNGLDTKARLLSAEASELGERLFEMRRVSRDVRGDMDATGSVPDQRIHELLSRNRTAQHRCLAQIERIEDLLDVARLEVACPEEEMPIDRGREELVQEVETELEAARRALEEVQRHSQTV